MSVHLAPLADSVTWIIIGTILALHETIGSQTIGILARIPKIGAGIHHAIITTPETDPRVGKDMQSTLHVVTVKKVVLPLRLTDLVPGHQSIACHTGNRYLRLTVEEATMTAMTDILPKAMHKITMTAIGVLTATTVHEMTVMIVVVGMIDGITLSMIHGCLLVTIIAPALLHRDLEMIMQKHLRAHSSVPDQTSAPLPLMPLALPLPLL